MKVAVTGGMGFVGTLLVKTLGSRYNWIIMGRSPADSKVMIDTFEVPYVSTDYSYDQLIQQLKGCEAVIHLAAKRYDSDALMNEYLPNIHISANLLEACRVLRISNIVHLSSIGVYDTNQPLPWEETCNASPMTFYGISKLTVEKLGEYYNFKYNMNVKSLRVAQVLGLGEREGYMLSTFINNANNKKKLTVWGNGDGARDYIYIKDVAEAIGCTIDHSQKSGIFNIGSNRCTSHRKLAELINIAFENEGNLEFLRDRAEDKTVYLMNSGKAKTELNWTPRWSIKEALSDIKRLAS